MKKTSPQIPKYPSQNDKSSVAAQFGLTNTNTHGHSGAAMDGGQIDYGNLLNKPTIPSGTALYAGKVISNAADTFFPSGWSVTHTGTGIYTLTHNLATTNYALVVTPDVSGEAYTIFGYAILGSNSVQVWFNQPDASFGFQDRDFSFLLTTQANP